jgi:sugar phosphate isomerase/epimerase
MKLGFLASNISDIAKAGRFGFAGIEMGIGAFGSLSEPLSQEVIEETQALCATHNVEITALAFYDLAWTPAVQGRPSTRLHARFDIAQALDVKGGRFDERFRRLRATGKATSNSSKSVSSRFARRRRSAG